MALIKSTAIPSGATTDYDIGQSLRFEDGSSDYLSWTPASAGNRKTWTFSCWVKRGNLDTEQVIFGGGTSGTNNCLIRFNSDNTLRFHNYVSSFQWNLTTTAVYRDTSSWYNIIAVADTSNGTSGDRVRLYINGQRITAFGTETYPSQNYDGLINSSIEHTLAKYPSASSYQDGYLAEVNFIDGTAKTPADFGETGDYGEWKPKKYSGTYGTNGFYLNFAGGGIMSATGGTITTNGDYKVNSFTADGTFTPSADGYVEYLVIGGGGAGAADGATTAGNGGGGAGGYRTGYLAVTESTAYSITVGAGGVGTTGSSQVNGANSVFSSITSAGGGGGGYFTSTPGAAGGSGGGGSAQTAAGGAANPAGQGNAGETATNGQGGGGGGGAGEAGGTDGTGQGGDGLASSITGSSVTRAGGGGGSRASGGARAGGDGGGGAGGNGGAGADGTANTGSGGGAGVSGGSAGSGGSGIVIIRYKFQ